MEMKLRFEAEESEAKGEKKKGKKKVLVWVSLAVLTRVAD